jgi:hypothetical protein
LPNPISVSVLGIDWNGMWDGEAIWISKFVPSDGTNVTEPAVLRALISYPVNEGEG